MIFNRVKVHYVSPELAKVRNCLIELRRSRCTKFHRILNMVGQFISLRRICVSSINKCIFHTLNTFRISNFCLGQLISSVFSSTNWIISILYENTIVSKINRSRWLIIKFCTLILTLFINVVPPKMFCSRSFFAFQKRSWAFIKWLCCIIYWCYTASAGQIISLVECIVYLVVSTLLLWLGK